jgi:hypothetical protein
MHSTHTLYACPLLILYTHTLYSHPLLCADSEVPCTLNHLRLHAPLYTHITLTMHSLYTHNALTIHSQYTHNALTIHSLYTHYALTIHSQYTHNTLTRLEAKHTRDPTIRIKNTLVPALQPASMATKE